MALRCFERASAVRPECVATTSKRGVQATADRAGRLDDRLGDRQDPAGPGDVVLPTCARRRWLRPALLDRASGQELETPLENIRFSASWAIWLMVATASTGYWPMAVSPESITASVPSSTALKTSLASARVGPARRLHAVEHLGRRDHRHPRPVAGVDDLLLHGRAPWTTSISTPRSPRATITASASAMIASRLATACGFSILATIRARLFRLSSSSRSRVMSSAWRTNESPTYATACSPVQSRSCKVLLGQRRDARAQRSAR